MYFYKEKMVQSTMAWLLGLNDHLGIRQEKKNRKIVYLPLNIIHELNSIIAFILLSLTLKLRLQPYYLCNQTATNYKKSLFFNI